MPAKVNKIESRSDLAVVLARYLRPKTVLSWPDVMAALDALTPEDKDKLLAVVNDPAFGMTERLVERLSGIVSRALAAKREALALAAATNMVKGETVTVGQLISLLSE